MHLLTYALAYLPGAGLPMGVGKWEINEEEEKVVGEGEEEEEEEKEDDDEV